MEFRKSTLDEIEILFQIIKACAEKMRANGIHQWDETYPSLDRIKQDISNQCMWTLWLENRIIGSMVMDEQQSDQYFALNWRYYESPILVVHRLAILPEFQGQGLGLKSMEFAEEYGRSMGYKSIRLDAFKENQGLQNFYKKLGYLEVGEIPLEYTAGPFVCFEKRL